MAGGGIVAAAGDNVLLYKSKITGYVVIMCIVAASGGLLFGYDLGITGGVTSMSPFLKKFFPSVYRASQGTSDTSPYCKYDNQGLQLFTSSLFIAGLLASPFAGWITKNKGRKLTMLLAGISFIIGALLCCFAVHLAMLIIGRIMLGVGVGFANQAVPLYLSEMAPPQLRGALNIMFQLATTIGILAAQLINYGTQYIDPWGWRLSLGLAVVPAAILTFGGIILPETPNSLIERGHLERGRHVLEKIRGTTEVGVEYQDIVAASERAAIVANPWANILKPKYRPELVIAIAIPFFQQLTGINSIMFYAPVLFKSLGSGDQASLLAAVIIGAVNCVATFVSIAVVDRAGRKLLFLEGGIQMCLAEVAMGIVLGVAFSGNTGGTLSKGTAYAVVIIVCIYVSAFAWSWGPLGWLVPSEIQPLETRSAGQSITVTTNFLFTFVIGQAFLSMLCGMKYGIFFFFAGWVVIMTIFVIFFLPETKNVPIEEMAGLWRSHWFWRRYHSVQAAGDELKEQHAAKGLPVAGAVQMQGYPSGVKAYDNV